MEFGFNNTIFEHAVHDTAIGIENKNSSGDEIVNMNFYAVRPEATRIRWNNAK